METPEPDPTSADRHGSSCLHVSLDNESNPSSVDQHRSSSLAVSADNESHFSSIDQHSSFSLPVSVDNECNSISINQRCSSSLPVNQVNAGNESHFTSVYQCLSSSLPVNADNETQHDTSTSTTTVLSVPSSSLATETTSSSSSLAGNIKKELALENLASETQTQSSIKVENSGHENCDGDIADEDSYEEVASPPSTAGDRETQCKILTKYIYINKPAKIKTGKRRLGVLYKQAFRHFQRSTVNSRSPSGKHLSVIEKICAKRQTEQESWKGVGKKGHKKKDGNGSARSEKRSNRVGGRASKVSATTKGKSKKSKETVTLEIEKETTASCRKSPRKAGKDKSAGKKHDDETAQSSRRKTKSKNRKTVSLSEKLDVIKQVESSSASLSSIAKSFSISKSMLTRIMKEKDKILNQHGSKSKVGAKKSKTNKIGKKGNTSKLPVIKIERCDDDVYENEVGFSLDSADDIKDFPLDAMSHLPGGNPSGVRSRKELTLQEKVEMIQELDKPEVKIKHIAQKYGVSTSAVSRVRKHKDRILSRSLSGDVCHQMRRSRECKDPVLDKALLKWYRAIEAVIDQPISITNTLLQDKARDIAMAMGKTYFPSVNWIIRWKYRHNIKCKSGRIESKDNLDELDCKVNMTDIIMAVEGQMLHSDMMLDGTEKMENGITFQKPEKYIVCEHCGIMTSRHKDKKRNTHLKDCPLSCKSHRRDLTLGEKAQVVRALESPGTKMVFLAKKYGVSSSAISRIHKNRVDIMARCAGAYVNVRRKRDRVSKEPEVERTLCDWYRQQLEYGYHVSGSTIREKAHEIAALMGKEFWPSDSWVFRWRHRNNVNAIGGSEEMEGLEEEMVEEIQEEEEEVMEKTVEEGGQMPPLEDDNQQKRKKGKKKKVVEEDDCEEEKMKSKFPRSVMCEKCGCVSARLKNNRIRNMRHAKGCPDLKPRHELTYEERVKLLKALEEPGATLSSVARHYGISASSMSRMNQKKASILNHGLDFACQKRIRDCKEPEVAKLLYTWFMEKQQEGIHVTGTKLKEKAGALAKERGREFKASTGWLGRWKHRYNVIFRPKEDEKPVRDMPRKKSFKKKGSPSQKEEESIETMENNHQIDGSGGSVITILPDESQPLQAPRMFLAQRYQNPWAVNHQPPSSCARPKEFVPGPNHAVPDESHVPYPYDHVPRHMFHNMFENFATAASYPMVEPSVPVRDYMQPDETEAQQASSSHHHHHHHHHHPIIPHQPPALTLQSAGMPQHHPIQPHQPAMHHASQSPVNSVQEEESIQQQQIMEACKLMNSFAKEKSLGEHVQAALRTIEMTVKGNERKGPQRATYTHM